MGEPVRGRLLFPGRPEVRWSALFVELTGVPLLWCPVSDRGWGPRCRGVGKKGAGGAITDELPVRDPDTEATLAGTADGDATLGGVEPAPPVAVVVTTGDTRPSRAFSARRARLASLARFSSSPRRRAAITAVSLTGGWFEEAGPEGSPEVPAGGNSAEDGEELVMRSSTGIPSASSFPASPVAALVGGPVGTEDLSTISPTSVVRTQVSPNDRSSPMNWVRVIWSVFTDGLGAFFAASA